MWDDMRLLQMRFQAESLGDSQAARIKVQQRLKKYDGFYSTLLPAGDSLDYAMFFGGLSGAEREMYRRLVRSYRLAVPAAVQDWVEATPGLGARSMARLIGLTGNPRTACPMHLEHGEPVPDATGPDGRPVTRPRSVRQLWSYCGVGDAGRVLHAGMTQEEFLACGRRRVRAVLFTIADLLVRAKGSSGGPGSPYTVLYETTKLRYEGKLHDSACTRCGPPGSPAPPGTPWHDVHKDRSARRILAKRVLRDLWRRSLGSPVLLALRPSLTPSRRAHLRRQP